MLWHWLPSLEDIVPDSLLMPSAFVAFALSLAGGITTLSMGGSVASHLVKVIAIVGSAVTALLLALLSLLVISSR